MANAAGRTALGADTRAASCSCRHRFVRGPVGLECRGDVAAGVASSLEVLLRVLLVGVWLFGGGAGRGLARPPSWPPHDDVSMPSRCTAANMAGRWKLTMASSHGVAHEYLRHGPAWARMRQRGVSPAWCTRAPVGAGTSRLVWVPRAERAGALEPHASAANSQTTPSACKGPPAYSLTQTMPRARPPRRRPGPPGCPRTRRPRRTAWRVSTGSGPGQRPRQCRGGCGSAAP